MPVVWYDTRVAWLPARSAMDVPHQRRAGDQAAGQFGQAHAGVVRQGLDAAVIAFEHQAAAGGQQRAGKGFDAAAADLVDADAAVDVFLQQFLGVDQVELEILFDHAGAFGIGQRFEAHRGRVDQRGDIGETHGIGAAIELQCALVAHDRVTGHVLAVAAAAVELR